MRRFLPLLLSVLVLAPATAAPRQAPEAELAEALRGRVAGAPVSCIRTTGLRSTRIIRDTAILFDAGGTIWVNRPVNGAEDLDHWDTLVTRTHEPRLCNVDVVRLFDNNLRFETGSVFLGEFVPYRRVRTGQR